MLGWEPIYEDICLTGGDWVFERTSAAGIPPGTTAEIVWANDVTWSANVDDSTIRWLVESTACTSEIIPDGTATIEAEMQTVAYRTDMED